MIEAALENEIEEDPLKDINDQTIPTTTVYNNKPIEIEPGRELNKETQEDHFPLLFVNQVLDTLVGKKFFSYLDSFSGHNSQISLEDQDKTTFTYLWGTFSYRVLPFRLCNAPATFERAILNIFADLINEGLEVYMDDFTPYGDVFELALQTLEKVLERCIATRICLSHKKFHMMMIEALILGHYISAAKIQVILLLPIPCTQTESNITIKDRLGKENLVADFLSHVPRTDDIVVVEDQFPNEHLFVVDMKTPWYVDFTNYLPVGKLPKHLMPRERKLIVEHNTQLSWIGGYLFHIGVDMHIYRCVREDKIYNILKAYHYGPCCGHFAYRGIGRKVLQMGYYWPTNFKDAKKLSRHAKTAKEWAALANLMKCPYIHS
eukprot:PITA_03321